jgi:hypothetical protein
LPRRSMIKRAMRSPATSLSVPITISAWGSKPPGRPEEFHLQPPTEPCVNLSIYTARPSHCPAISR